MQESFCEFYVKRHNGRRLVWQNTLGRTLTLAIAVENSYLALSHIWF